MSPEDFAAIGAGDIVRYHPASGYRSLVVVVTCERVIPGWLRVVDLKDAGAAWTLASLPQYSTATDLTDEEQVLVMKHNLQDTAG